MTLRKPQQEGPAQTSSFHRAEVRFPSQRARPGHDQPLELVSSSQEELEAMALARESRTCVSWIPHRVTRTDTSCT